MTFAFALFPYEWEYAKYSQDRCSMQGCMAEVVAYKPETKKLTKDTNEYVSVYYEEDNYTLDEYSAQKIKSFLKKKKNAQWIEIIGYTDGCGSHQYNNILSHRRASGVELFLKSHFPGIIVTKRWRGEATGSHSDEAKRVDIVVKNKKTEKYIPPKIIADFYLIDGSGSMAGEKWAKWQYAIGYWKPSHARVFVSTDSYIPKFRTLSSIAPSGGTEIYYSYWSILDLMEPGQTLIIISDFNTTVPLTSAEYDRIKKKSNLKRVVIRTIRLN